MALIQDISARRASTQRPHGRTSKVREEAAVPGAQKEKCYLDYGSITSARARFRRAAEVAMRAVGTGELHLLCHNIGMYADLPDGHPCSRASLRAELEAERDLELKMARGLSLVGKAGL